MSKESADGKGMSIVEAIAGALFLFGFAVWVTYALITEGLSALGIVSRQWWEYLIFLGLVVLAFVKGSKCLFSVFLHVAKVPPEDRFWKEDNAEERIWRVVGGITAFGVLGFGLLVSLDGSSSAAPAVTTGELIIIALLAVVLYNQRRK